MKKQIIFKIVLSFLLLLITILTFFDFFNHFNKIILAFEQLGKEEFFLRLSKGFWVNFYNYILPIISSGACILVNIFILIYINVTDIKKITFSLIEKWQAGKETRLQKKKERLQKQLSEIEKRE